MDSMSAPPLDAQSGTAAGPASAGEPSCRPGKVPVSVLIPTLNEAKNLPRCLDHLTWADEVVILDSNSTDDTPKIAAAYGAKLANFTWNGHWPKKRNWALRHGPMKHDWVLMVDADEWLMPEVEAEVAQVIKSDKYVGYYINRRFIFMGRWLRHCGYYPSWNLRLLKRGYGEFERLTNVEDTGSGDNEVHEHVVVKGPVGYLKAEMLHLAYPDIATFVEKHNRYSSWEAAVQLAGVHRKQEHGFSGNTSLNWRRRLKQLSRLLPFRPTLRFLYSYILQRGFLDGSVGFHFCRLLAMYEFLSVAKYHEMKQARDDQRLSRQLSDVPARNWKETTEAQAIV
ncbi:MAG: glycosyltransferase [Phycisphaerales bacterium]|nr:glycosyltransferase [Phycisphaerales bacterium]